jgi:hypothetical protein
LGFDALAPDGFLATEQTQTLPPSTESLFARIAPDGQLFQRVDSREMRAAA